FERQFLGGELEVELNPQGTLAERIRAGGCGIGGFYTPTGVGTQIAAGKETRTIDGREYVLESPLVADFAIVRAFKGDKWGNLVFRETARNFSPLMCRAARVTIAEVEQLVEVGEIDPDRFTSHRSSSSASSWAATTRSGSRSGPCASGSKDGRGGCPDALDKRTAGPAHRP